MSLQSHASEWNHFFKVLSTAVCSCLFVAGFQFLLDQFLVTANILLYEPRCEKTGLRGFPTRSDINRAAQSPKMARGLKFRI